MVSTLREASNSRPAGRPSLKTFLFLPILFGVLAGRGPLPVALAETQTANDPAADKMLHELYSAFGIGPGGSRTLVPTSSRNSPVISTASTSSLSSSQNQTQTSSPSQTQTSSSSRNQTQTQTQKNPSQGQGGTGFRAAHSAAPDGSTSSTSGISSGSGSRDHGRAVFANFVVRNAENHTVDCWIEGTKLAASAGFDALALSVGNEPWEARQVANAFCAASKFNNASETAKTTDASRSGFKLFLSFNMTSLPCSSVEDGSILRQYIRTYANHTDYFRYNGRMLVSTFAGEDCRFGQESLDEGWKHALRPMSANASAVPEVWFVPAFFAPPDMLSNSTAIDGLFNWNSAWPSRGHPTAFATDQSYISALGNKTYMSAISLWSWVHRDRNEDHSACGPDTRSFGARWESLVKNRDSVSLVEVVTWGDNFGGSDVGPSGGPFSLPHGAKAAELRNSYRSDSLQGQRRPGKGILEQVAPLMKYYIEAFKSGSYLSVARDKVFLWVEAHLRKGNCSGFEHDSTPRGGEWIQDRISAYALLSAPGNATLTCGPSSNSAVVPCGLSKLRLTLDGTDCCKADATLTHGSETRSIVEQREEVDMTMIQRWVPLPKDWESEENLAILVPVPVV